MGGSIACMSCIERDNEEQCTRLKAENHVAGETPRVGAQSKQVDDELQAKINAIVKHRQDRKQSPTPSSARGELQEQINTILKARVEPPSKPQAASKSDAELKEQMNAIVKSRMECSPQSPAPGKSCNELQDQINAIVGAHTQSLNQQRLSCASPTADSWAWELPTPSPGPESYTDTDLAYHANMVLSNAKVRTTPGKFEPAVYVHWEAFEEEVAPRQLFGFSELDCSAQEYVPSTTVVESEVQAEPIIELVPSATIADSEAQAVPCSVDPKAEKNEARAFDINDIPSPTRSRAKKQQWTVPAATDIAQSTDNGVEAVQLASLSCDVVEEAAKPDDADYVSCCGTEIEAEQEEAARLKEIKDKADAERLAMDKSCMDTFLESVKTVAWRDRVRTPIKGSNLYTKHIRPCRPAGTSVDVKDSNFMNLGTFLSFLESEGLIRLKPGLTDPVVTEVNFDACRKYKYTGRKQSATIAAPHEAGCACRKCTAVLQWQ